MRYVFVVEMPIAMHAEVEAKNVTEAIDKVLEMPVQTLCHQCSSGGPDEWSNSGEFDAEPTSCKLVEVFVGKREPNAEELAELRDCWDGPVSVGKLP